VTSSMLWMLDTNIASYVIKRRYAGIRARLEAMDPSSVCISVITQSELLYGLSKLPADHSLHYRVPRFLESIHCLSWDSAAAEVHASLHHRLVSTGQIIGEMDTMIAAHAIALGATLVTNNTRHFARISPPLRLENWVTTDDDPASHAESG